MIFIILAVKLNNLLSNKPQAKRTGYFCLQAVADMLGCHVSLLQANSSTQKSERLHNYAADDGAQRLPSWSLPKRIRSAPSEEVAGTARPMQDLSPLWHPPALIIYCNSLVACLSAEQIGRLLRVQNSATRLVLKRKEKTRTRDHVTPLRPHNTTVEWTSLAACEVPLPVQDWNFSVAGC